MGGGKTGARPVSRCPDINSALAQIRGFSDLCPAGSSAGDELEALSSADVSLLLSPSVGASSSPEHGFDQYDPLRRLLDDGEPVGHEQEAAWVSQYIDAELRAIGVILARSAGGAMLAAFHPELGSEPDVLLQKIEAACAVLKGRSVGPEPHITAQVLDQLGIVRHVRAQLLEHMNIRVENENSLFDGDPAGAASFRSCYQELLRLRATLIESNIRFVGWQVARRRASSIDRRDLLLAGVAGLLRGVIYFDPARKARIITYAQYWIKQSVDRTVDALAPVLRSPAHLKHYRSQLFSARLAFQDEQAREPNTAELAEACSKNVGQIENILASLRSARSPDVQRTPAGEPVGDVIYDESWPTPAQTEAKIALSRLLSEAVAQLGERGENGIRMQQILNRRFGLLGDEEMTLQDIGEVFDVSRERIRQIQEKTLEDLYRRHGSELARLLPIWLDQAPAMIPTVRTSSDSSAAGGNLL